MRPITITFAFLLVLAALFSSCDRPLLDESPDVTAAANFEMLWEDLDRHYSSFAINGLDWDSIYTAYRPRAEDSHTEAATWQLMSELLEALDDEHVKLFDDANGRFFGSGLAGAEAAEAAFSLELIAGQYLDVETLGAPNNYVLYGKSQDGKVGYIYIAALLDEDPSVMQLVLDKLGGVQAIIVDVRNCVGGYDKLGARYAAYFSDGVHHLYDARFRNGPEHANLSEPEAYYSHSPRASGFSGPVILLTDRNTVSEGEIFTLNMRSFAHVVHMGTTTAGAQSLVSPARFLPNGWRYEYSIQLITLPDGSSYEGAGIPPQLPVANTAADIESGKDVVLEAAREYLREEFGI